MHTLRWAPAGILLLAACGSGTDLPEGTYKNDEYKFALVPPAGWTVVTPETAGEFLKQHGDRVTSFMRDGFLFPVQGKTSFVIAYVKTDAPEPLLPVIAVTHNSVGLPKVGEAEKAKSRQALEGKVRASRYDHYDFESESIIDVGDLKGIRIVYRGQVRSKLHSNPGQYASFLLRQDETMISSKERSHFVSMGADQKGWDEHLSTFNQVLASFRNLDRR